jgi:cellulose synthase/poly-beta-1,6-N-acetylglucosamine synthase-like glycosyltransferase
VTFETISLIVFVASSLAIGYVYLGYPILVIAASRLFPREVARGAVEPTVTVIITAYNEEQDISRKLENTLELEYPAEKLEVMVASDGSTDRTDEIVLGYRDRGVRLFRQDGRLGKTYTQNKAVEQAGGEIILFSDATTTYRKDVVRTLVRNFNDPSVGCVAGKLVYVDDTESAVGTGARSYWNYENVLKMSESRVCSMIGVSGCMYAVRRSAYHPMYPEACSDFLISTQIFRDGLRSVYEGDAVCFEDTNRSSGKEFRMRIRVIAQTFGDLWRNKDMMNPFKSGFYAIQLLSHKVGRYSVPFLLMLILLSSLVLAASYKIFAAIVLLQVLFYAAAFLGWFLQRNGISNRLLAIPFYFVLGNAATVAGFFKFLTGERYAQWEPARGPG